MYQVKEIADVFVDACVRDPSGDLLFLSCYGRDGAIHQFHAAFSLGVQEGGLNAFTLLEPYAEEATGQIRQREASWVDVGDGARLEKYSGRLPRENLFGNLAHTWIYDPVILRPDRANRTAWLLDSEAYSADSEPRVMREIWALYRLLSAAAGRVERGDPGGDLRGLRHAHAPVVIPAHRAGGGGEGEPARELPRAGLGDGQGRHHRAPGEKRARLRRVA
jgi:hypothetical protein